MVYQASRHSRGQTGVVCVSVITQTGVNDLDFDMWAIFRYKRTHTRERKSQILRDRKDSR